MTDPAGGPAPVIGAIADDVTGATDIAVAFRRNGLRTFLAFGVPDGPVSGVEAVVVALKTRMIEPEAAVARSLSAWEWFKESGIRRCYFKYCSTFDSTARGNIGPVLDALAEAIGAETVVTTPASPEHGRTQYSGHLFVNDVLLSESHMRDHPVTPMRDSNLPRLLAAQTPATVGLLRHRDVARGEAAIAERVAEAVGDGTRYLLADALTDTDLRELGRAVADHPLTAGAAGLAGGLAAALAERRSASGQSPAVEDAAPSERRTAGPPARPVAIDAAALAERPTALEHRQAVDAPVPTERRTAGPHARPAVEDDATKPETPTPARTEPENGSTPVAREALETDASPRGPAVVLSGSCSARTLEQVAYLRGLGRPAHYLDAAATPDAEALAAATLAWYDTLPDDPAPLIYSSVTPERLRHIQAELGAERAAAVLETATGRIAEELAKRGVKRFIAAGGETSGAVVAALGVQGGLIGAEAARGVPWIHDSATGLSLLLKSGNFGHPELLAEAAKAAT